MIDIAIENYQHVAALPMLWDNIKAQYSSYFMHNPTRAVLIAASVISMAFTIIFLCQKKAARTWTRKPHNKTGCDHQDNSNPIDSGSPLRQRHKPTTQMPACTSPQTSASPQSVPRVVDTAQAVPVLLVTDGHDRQRICKCLHSAGLEHAVASPGRETLARISEKSYDLVIIDSIVMEIGFLAASRIIQTAPSGSSTSMLIITDSSARLEHAGESKWRIDYILRPYDDSLLTARIAGLLRGETPPAPAGKICPINQLMEDLQQKIGEMRELTGGLDTGKIELQSRIFTELGYSTAPEHDLAAMEDAISDINTQLQHLQQLSESVSRSETDHTA